VTIANTCNNFKGFFPPVKFNHILSFFFPPRWDNIWVVLRIKLLWRWTLSSRTAQQSQQDPVPQTNYKQKDEGFGPSGRGPKVLGSIPSTAFKKEYIR
jgi:hypothetical protein